MVAAFFFSSPIVCHIKFILSISICMGVYVLILLVSDLRRGPMGV